VMLVVIVRMFVIVRVIVAAHSPASSAR